MQERAFDRRRDDDFIVTNYLPIRRPPADVIGTPSLARRLRVFVQPTIPTCRAVVYHSFASFLANSIARYSISLDTSRRAFRLDAILPLFIRMLIVGYARRARNVRCTMWQTRCSYSQCKSRHFHLDHEFQNASDVRKEKSRFSVNLKR